MKFSKSQNNSNFSKIQFNLYVKRHFSPSMNFQNLVKLQNQSQILTNQNPPITSQFSRNKIKKIPENI